MRKTCFQPAWIIISLLCSHFVGAASLTPNEAVMATTQEVLTRLELDKARLKAEPGYSKEIVRELIVPHMDFRTMTALILGKNWSIMSEAKQDCFSSSFRKLLIERYSDILLSYRDQDIQYQPAKPIGKRGYVSVLQTLTRGDKKPLTIGYPMRPQGEVWVVVDLVVDDVSLIRSYRLMYRKEIKQKGLADFIQGFEGCRN